MLATQLPGGVLLLNVGPYAINRNVNPTEINESYFVRHDGGSPGDPNGESITVLAFGASQSFTGIKQIIADAGDGEDIIELGADVLSIALIAGGLGDDTLYTGLGGGTLLGGPGRDKLYGRGGVDYLYGNEDRDEIYGGGSGDHLYGGDDNDSLYGEDGDDFFYADLGNDRIYGGGGTDKVVAEADASFSLTNTKLTGLGTDILSSIEAADLTGGASANLFTVSNWTGSATLDAAGGNDDYRVTFNAGNSGTVSITDSSGSSDDLEVRGTTTEDTILVAIGQVSRGSQVVSYTGIEDLVVDGKQGADNIKVQSTSGVPVIIRGDQAVDLIEVGLGNLSAIQAAVFVDGGSNIDTLRASDELDTVSNTGKLVSGLLTGLGLGAAGIAFNASTDNVEVRLGSGSDDFLVESVLKVPTADIIGTSIIANGGNDLISVGSRIATNAGDLDAIQTKLNIFGGSDTGGSIETATGST